MQSTVKKYLQQLETKNDHIGFQLWRAANSWKRNMKHSLKPYGLTPVRFLLLSSIAWHQYHAKDATQSRVAQHTNSNVMMISQLARKLEADGFIQRERSTEDSRSRTLVLTPIGERALAESIPAIQLIEKALFNLTPEERSLLIQALVKVNT